MAGVESPKSSIAAGVPPRYDRSFIFSVRRPDLRIRFWFVILILAVPTMGFSQSTLNFPKFFSPAELPVSGFAIVNPNSGTATVNFKLYSASGQLVSSQDQTYGSGTQTARTGNEIFTNLGSGGWVQATSTTPGLQGFWMNYNATLTYIDGAEAATSAMDQVIPLVAATTEVNVANPAPSPNSVTITLFGESGALGSPVTQTIQPNGVYQGIVAEMFPGVAIGDARYVRVTGTAQVASTAVVRGYLAPRETVVINGIDRTTSLTQMNFPHVVSGGGNWTTEVGITNLAAAPQSVTISFTPKGGGAPISVSRQLAANGGLRSTAQSLFGFNPADFQDGWVRVTGTAPIAGFVAYADTVTGGVAVVPVQETPRAQMLFAHIADLDPFYTGVAVLNTNTTTASVSISAMTPEGTLIGTNTFDVGRDSKTARLLVELIPQTQARNRDGGFLFVSSNVPLYGIELFFNRNFAAVSNVAAGALAPGIQYVVPGGGGAPAVAPTLTSVSPTSAERGSTITLAGTAFSSTPASNTVIFTTATGSVNATSVSATATSLTVVVPQSAISGPVFVTVGGLNSSTRILEVLGSSTAPLTPTTVNVTAGSTTTSVDIVVPAAAAGLNVTGIGVGDAGTMINFGSSSVDISRGQTRQLLLTGTGLSASTTVSVSGSGVTLTGLQFQSGVVFINIAVASSAPAGARNVVVTNSNRDTAVLTGGLFIR
jgi:hypothetical protein